MLQIHLLKNDSAITYYSMSKKIKSDSPSLHKTHLTTIFFSYAVFALIFGLAYRYAINPDGVSQLRLAGYIAEGNFQQSVTSGWSPLFTWLMSFFLFIGFEGLSAARMATALSGAGLLLCSWFLALRFDLSENIRFIAVLIAALLISDWSIRNIGADLPVAALTLFYLYLITDRNIIKDKKIPFFCGITGGVSYLAHHYSFPFFIVHFPSMLLLKGHMDRGREGFPSKEVFTSWVAGIAGFFIIASIWVGVVSIKYGELTISSKGGIAHASMGPADVDRRPPHFYGGLNKPENEYSIHVFEDPSGLIFKTWSPFESKEYFFHQLKIIKNNSVDLLNHFVAKSPFFTYAFMIGILAFIPIVILLTPLNDKKKFMYAWVGITFSIYCSGFLLLIARSPRRFYALMIVLLLLSFHFFEEMTKALGDVVSDRRKKLLPFYLLIIIVPAFALKPGIHLLKSIDNVITAEQLNPYEEIAEQIDTIRFSSPYAIIRSSQKPHTDTYIAYYLKKQLLGRPLAEDAEGIAKEMKAAGAKSLMVFDNMEIVEELRSDERYLHIASKRFEDSARYEQTVNINIRDHEIITGWDKEVNIFAVE
jgi:hypothetical protein